MVWSSILSRQLRQINSNQLKPSVQLISSSPRNSSDKIIFPRRYFSLVKPGADLSSFSEKRGASKVVKKPTGNKIPVNEKIRVPLMRVICPDGKDLGVLTRNVALDKASYFKMDLVLVAPNNDPPTCKIMNHRLIVKEKVKSARAKKSADYPKEIKFKSKVDAHDFDFKTKNIVTFLKNGHSVNVTINKLKWDVNADESMPKNMERILDEVKDYIHPVEAKESKVGQLFVTLRPKLRK
jgi:translation initiation factor IF-3